MPGGNGGGDGKSKAEGGSVAEPALHGNLATEQFDQPAHQGEAQAGSLVMRGVEAAEDVRQRSASMPRPESRTENCTLSFCSLACSRMVPFSGV